jgi:hypothetical protein
MNSNLTENRLGQVLLAGPLWPRMYSKQLSIPSRRASYITMALSKLSPN